MKHIWFYFGVLVMPMIHAQPVIQWQKTFGGSLNDEARCIQQTRDRGFILTGYTVSDDGDVGPNHGYNEFWVIKLDSIGIIQWKKVFGGSSHDDAFAIDQTADEGFIMAGYTKSNDGDVTGYHGDYDAWVVKITKDGDLEWQKCLGGSGTTQLYPI